MPDPFIGEIRCFGFDFVPNGWASCAGQSMPINQNQALFSLLGTMYGGDGRSRSTCRTCVVACRCRSGRARASRPTPRARWAETSR